MLFVLHVLRHRGSVISTTCIKTPWECYLYYMYLDTVGVLFLLHVLRHRGSVICTTCIKTLRECYLYYMY